MKRVGQIYRENIVNRIKEGVDGHKGVFLINYSELGGLESSDLRKSLNQAGADVYVSKNRIARLALKDLKQQSIAEKVDGQIAFVWSNEDAVVIAKILVKYAKDLKNLTVAGGILEGEILEESDVKKLSELPPRNALLGQLLGTIQAPITQLLGAFNAKSRELLSIMKQLSEKKGGNENV